MVVVMKERASEAQIDSVIARLIELGMDVHRSSGTTRTVLGVVGAHKVEKELIEILDGVHEVLRITEPYKRASRTFKPEDTIIVMDDVRVGGDEVIVMAGPCSAETDEQVMASAAAVIAYAVLLPVRVIRMAWPEHVLDLGVVRRKIPPTRDPADVGPPKAVDVR